MTLKNQGLLNVRNGDKAAGFHYPTKPAKEAIQKDKEFGPRSALVPDGNFKLTCRTASYLTERKNRDGEVTKLQKPMINATWEAFDAADKPYGVFRDSHSLPIQLTEDEDVSGSERFWSMMGRSFAEHDGTLDKYLAADMPACTPAWMEGRSGYARIRVTASKTGSHARYSGIHFFMSKEEFMRNPGPAVGGATVPAQSTNGEPPEVAGENAPDFTDDDIPF